MYFLILNLILIQGFAYASHFRYGSMTWTPVSNGTSGGSYYVVLALTTSWGWRNDFADYTGCNNSIISGGQLMGVAASIYCTGCDVSDVVLTDSQMYCTAYSPASYEDWSFGFRTQSLTINPVSSSLEIFFPGSAWQALVPVVNATWMVKAKINLLPRSDNGLINTSPVISSYPSYCVRQGFNYTVLIPIADVNGDDLRCRWAVNSTTSDECAGICGIITNVAILSYSKSSNGTECYLTFRGDIASYGKIIV